MTYMQKMKEFFIWKDEKWRDCKPCTFIELYQDYVEKHSAFVRQIISEMKRSICGKPEVPRTADQALMQYVSQALQCEGRQPEYDVNPPDTCDICMKPLKRRRFMVDGKVRGHSAWACMCSDCFLAFGEGIAWGKGQLYQQNPQGWRLVGGECPKDEV